MKHLLKIACLAALLPLGALAQPYPAKPIRLIVPWATGTPSDVQARSIGDIMGARLGQPIVVENKPGVSGTIGLTEALRQPSDGYTLYSLSSASLVAPLLYPTQKIDFAKTLRPVGLEAWSYNVLVVPTTSKIKSVAELVEAARANPGRLSYASGGNGVPAHLAGELFNQQLNVQTTHVPYNQFQMVIADLVTDRVNFMFLTASAALPQIQGGKLRALASTGAKRLPTLPDVPTMVELGHPDFVLRSFDAVMVKADTPPEIVKQLNAALNHALESSEVRKRLAPLGLETEPMSPEALGQVVESESAKWQQIGRAARIKAD